MTQLYRIDLTGSFDIGANDSWADLFREAIDEELLVPVNHCSCCVYISVREVEPQLEDDDYDS